MKKDVDINLLSIVGPNNPETMEAQELDGGTKYDDVLKLSNCSNIHLSGWKLKGGKEDCVDINRGKHISLIDFKMAPIYNGVTIKGGATDVFIVADIEAGKQKSDFTLGQYSDQSPDRVRNVKLNVVKSDKSKVKIVLWDADEPTFVGGGPYQVVKIPTIIVWVWFFFRRQILARYYKKFG